MLISTISYNAILFLQQYCHSSSPFSCYLAIYYMQQCALSRVSMSRHKTGYVISYHGILCHDMSYVTTIAASLVCMRMYVCMYVHVCDGWITVFFRARDSHPTTKWPYLARSNARLNYSAC